MNEGFQLYTVREAARKLGLPVAWLQREASSGRIPTVRIGRSLHLRLEDVTRILEQWLEAGHEMPKQDDSGGDS